MGRSPRSAKGNVIYHAINRANGRLAMFEQDSDYEAFERIVEEAKTKIPMRIYAYTLMPNHWHFILHPFENNDLSSFLRWLTLTHTQRWNVYRHRVGYGHLYQGRFKSFPVQEDTYFIQLCRYVERNPLRAGLVDKAEDWRWSSLWRRLNGNEKQKQLLEPWPIPQENNYLHIVNQTQSEAVLTDIRHSLQRGKPYGESSWIAKMVTLLGLESTIKPHGRPRKGT